MIALHLTEVLLVFIHIIAVAFNCGSNCKTKSIALALSFIHCHTALSLPKQQLQGHEQPRTRGAVPLLSHREMGLELSRWEGGVGRKGRGGLGHGFKNNLGVPALGE